MNKKATSKDYKFPEKCLKDLKDFLKKNSSLFEIQKKNFVDVINKCKRRDDKAKANDIAFICKLQTGARYVCIAKEDKVFKSNVMKSEARLMRLQENLAKEEERMTKLRAKESERKEQESMQVELNLSNDEDESNERGKEKDDIDKDFELDPLSNKRKIKSDTRVCLTLSLDEIIQEWNPFITR